MKHRCRVMYLLAKLKPFEQKEHFSLTEQNGLVWNLAYVRNGTDLPGESNPQPPGWKSNALTHWPTDPTLPCKRLFAGFLILSRPKCALVWGNCHEVAQ